MALKDAKSKATNSEKKIFDYIAMMYNCREGGLTLRQKVLYLPQIALICHTPHIIP